MSRPRLRIVSPNEVSKAPPTDDVDRVFVGQTHPALRIALIDARWPASGHPGASAHRSFHAMATALSREARVEVFARSRFEALLGRDVMSKVARSWNRGYDIAYVFGIPYGLALLRRSSPGCSLIVHIDEGDLRECGSPEARRALGYADAITTSCGPSLHRLQQLLPELSQRMQVMRPGANEEFLTVPSRPGQSQNVLCISPPSAESEIGALLLAFTHVAAANPQTQLTVMGDGSARRFARILRRHARELGSYVRFEESVPYPDVGNYYARAGVFVLPSFSGDFAVTELLDAMAAGLPVVCARTDVSAEIVTDGITGFLVDPSDIYSFGNVLRKLLDDPALRRQVGAAARFDVARRFTWRSFLEALHRLRHRG